MIGGVKIAAVGSAIPEKILTNFDIEKLVDTNDEWITSRTGIKERRIAKEGEAASDFAVMSAKNTLTQAGIDARDVDLIIVATVTPDSPLPATACIVQAQLNAMNAAAFDLAAGCSGFLYALSVGSQFVKTKTYKNVLVIGVDLLSRLVNWKDRKTCVLFGDGAGSVLLQPAKEGEGVLSVFLGADGTNGKFLSIEAGGSKLPPSLETINSDRHFIKMSGNEIFKNAVREMENSLLKALKLSKLTPQDLDLLIPHQANLRIIESVRKRMNMNEDQVIVNISRYGNTSSASIPIALDEAIRDKKIQKGDIIGLAAFGAGLTWGAAVLRW